MTAMLNEQITVFLKFYIMAKYYDNHDKKGTKIRCARKHMLLEYQYLFFLNHHENMLI